MPKWSRPATNSIALRSALWSAIRRRAAEIEAAQEVLGELERLLQGTALLRELTPRALDAISGVGERLSAPLVAAALANLGVRSAAVSATEVIVTDATTAAPNR